MPNPHACERCGEDCKSAAGLHSHRMMDDRCEVIKRSPTEGFLTPEAVVQFKGRKQWGKGFPEEQKWRAIFRVIFPDHPVPSPYYDHGALVSSQAQPTNTTVDTAVGNSLSTILGTTLSSSSPLVNHNGSMWMQVADYATSLAQSLPADEERELGFQLGQDLGVDPEKYSLLAKRFRREQLKGLQIALGIPVSNPLLEAAHETCRPRNGPDDAPLAWGSGASGFSVSGSIASPTSHPSGPTVAYEPSSLEIDDQISASPPFNDGFSYQEMMECADQLDGAPWDYTLFQTE